MRADTTMSVLDMHFNRPKGMILLGVVLACHCQVLVCYKMMHKTSEMKTLLSTNYAMKKNMGIRSVHRSSTIKMKALK